MIARKDGIFSIICAVSLLFFVCMPLSICKATDATFTVSANTDDADEVVSGTVYVTDESSYFNRHVGFRFQNVTIPPGSTITKATLEAFSNATGTTSFSVDIAAQNADNSLTFATNNGNITSRPLTIAQTLWSTDSTYYTVGQSFSSPNFAASIQEVINRSGWTSGNSLVVITTPNSGNKGIFKRSGKPIYAPKLHITYTNSSPLVAHWKFDEGVGITAADSTPNSNDATLQSGASWATDCLSRNIIEFDGFSGNAVTSSPFSPPSAGTVAFWMRSAGAPSARQRLFGVNEDWEARQETDGSIKFDLGASPIVDNEPFTTMALDDEERWYHIAAIYDTSDDSYAVYVNGVLESSGTSPVDLVSQSAGFLTFGTRTGSSEHWKGALRDFRVYSTKLSAAEIAELYGIVAHWTFDETNGTVAVDASGRGNDAEYISSPTLGTAGAFPPQTDSSVQLDGYSEYVTANQGLLNDVEEFTLAGWFRSSDLGPVKSYFGQYDLVEVGIDMSARQLELWTDAGGSLTAPNALMPGKWQHIAAVGTRTSLTLYVNGRKVATGGTGATDYGNNAEIFKVGEGVMESSGNYFNGRVDDVQVYQRALCPYQIYEVYKGGRPDGVRIIKWIEVR